MPWSRVGYGIPPSTIPYDGHVATNSYGVMTTPQHDPVWVICSRPDHGTYEDLSKQMASNGNNSGVICG